jgi:hypothetical protein
MQGIKAISVSLAFILSPMLLLFLFSGCKPAIEAQQNDPESMINTAHLDHLYDEKLVGKDTVGIIHIYSEYPDYAWKDDGDEGIACVDDASRAAIFYIYQYGISKSEEHLRKGKMLLKFLLAMQDTSGYYFNFIWEDGSIHKEGPTSIAGPHFWSWRVLWAFGEVMDILEMAEEKDALFYDIIAQRQKLVQAVLKEPRFRSTQTDTAMGLVIPTWLPSGSGTDQAAIMMMGLSDMIVQQSRYGNEFMEDSIRSFMKHLADGVTMMQIVQKDSLHNGAFLSWENLWHAYANIQAYALFDVGYLLSNEEMVKRAMYEVEHFYPAILKHGGLDHFRVKKTGNIISRYDTQPFSQIAYGRRPMIWGALRAFGKTNDVKYLDLARDLGKWFSGDNAAGIAMYDPATGRGYDGIIGPGKINKNAGAESTIESLLALQALERFSGD